MSLIYRGQTAQPSTLVNTHPIDAKGWFLGQSFSIRSAQYQTRTASTLMQYRGISYQA